MRVLCRRPGSLYNSGLLRGRSRAGGFGGGDCGNPNCNGNGGGGGILNGGGGGILGFMMMQVMMSGGLFGPDDDDY